MRGECFREFGAQLKKDVQLLTKAKCEVICFQEMSSLCTSFVEGELQPKGWRRVSYSPQTLVTFFAPSLTLIHYKAHPIWLDGKALTKKVRHVLHTDFCRGPCPSAGQSAQIYSVWNNHTINGSSKE